MKKPPFNFGPVLQALLAQYPNVTRKDLAAAGGDIDSTTLHRMIHGDTQPHIDHLRAWYAAVGSLPNAFRQACFNVIGQAACPPTACVPVDDNLDADGDGLVTRTDARVWDARQQAAAARRRMHLEEALDDGVISPEELAADEILSNESIALTEKSKRALCRVAQGAIQHPARPVWRR